jgi:hypothetical protein
LRRRKTGVEQPPTRDAARRPEGVT